MRLGGWLCLVLGAACLVTAAVLGVLTIQQAGLISAYHHARPCPSAAPADASCLRTVDGSVTGVTEFPGGGRVSADYALDVRTARATLQLTFGTDSAMLASVVDGEPAVVTMWHGEPVSVRTAGRSQATTSVPETTLASDLSAAEVAAGAGALVLLGVLTIGRSRDSGGVLRSRPLAGAALCALAFCGVVMLVSGLALGGHPSRVGPDLSGTGAALVVVLGLSGWIFVASRRRAVGGAGGQAHAPGQAAGGLSHPAGRHGLAASGSSQATAGPRPAADRRPVWSAHRARTPLRTRTPLTGMPRSAWPRALAARAARFVPVLLTVGVLFGILFSCQDGPPALAYRHAPGCLGETNLATCAGEFTAVINGVRAPADGADFTDVSYVTDDDSINAWARFDGNATALASTASAAESTRAPLTIMVWRRSIMGAQLGGRWYWAQGEPPGNATATVLLAVSFGLLLLAVRLRIHRRAGRGPSLRRLISGATAGAGTAGRQLLLEDLGQVAGAAAATVLLGYGFWPAAILALSVLGWLGLSARRWSRRRPLPSDTAPVIGRG